MIFPLLIIAVLLGGIIPTFADGTAPILTPPKINFTVPKTTQIQLANDVVNRINKFVYNPPTYMGMDLSSDGKILATQNNFQKISTVLNRLKNSRFYFFPNLLSRRAMVYIYAPALVVGAAIDYYSNRLKEQFQNASSSAPPTVGSATVPPSVPPPAGCQYLPWCPRYYKQYTVCKYQNDPNNNLQSFNVRYISSWTVNSDGTCYPKVSYYYVSSSSIPVGSCVSYMAEANYGNYPSGFLPGQEPESFLPMRCSNGTTDDETKKTYITPIPVDDVINAIQSSASDFTSSLTLPNDSSIRTPGDIPLPLGSSDGNVILDMPGVSPDGIFSDDLTMPGNDVPDIPLNLPVNISYNMPSGNVYNDTNSNTSNPSDPTYTSSDGNLDTSVDIPQKKDLKGLIQSNIDAVKKKFNFDTSGCSGGTCSFQIPVFDKTATLDFCQYADVLSLIGNIILTFSYFYAFFIIVKGG
jgi:hypothetical protein